MINDLSIIVKVINDDDVIGLQICSDLAKMKKSIIGTQKKQAYSDLLKYLFNVAIYGIVSKDNGIYVTDPDYNGH